MSRVDDRERRVVEFRQHEAMFCLSGPSTTEAPAMLFVVWHEDVGKFFRRRCVHSGPLTLALASISRLATYLGHLGADSGTFVHVSGDLKWIVRQVQKGR